MSTNELILSIIIIHAVAQVVSRLISYLEIAALIRMWEAKSNNNEEV